MPISEDEWDAGTTGTEAGDPDTTPVGEYETERDLIVAFLGENADNAYTRAEIIRGVDFGETEDPDRVTSDLGHVSPTEQLVDLVGNLTASAIVVDDIDAALDELVDEGTVVPKEIERAGETVTHTDWPVT